MPNPGGLFQQETEHIWKLSKALQAIEEKREEEVEKASKRDSDGS